VAAAVAVEDPAEHARRVEARAAEPVDRSFGTDERDGAQVADDAVIGDGEVVPGVPDHAANLRVPPLRRIGGIASPSPATPGKGMTVAPVESPRRCRRTRRQAPTRRRAASAAPMPPSASTK